MSVYRCYSCENYFDSDEVGCNAHPNNDCELICDSCAEEYVCTECGENEHKYMNYFEGSDEYICSPCLDYGI